MAPSLKTYPRCLFLKVSSKNRSHGRADIALTINFGQHQETFIGGFVKFGLRCGELCLTLKDAELPYEDNRLAVQLVKEIVTNVETESSKKQTKSQHKKSGVKLNTSSMGLSEEESKLFAQEDRISLAKKLVETAHQIRAEGSESNPVWVFEVKDTKPVLLGGLFGETIGTLVRKDKTFNASAFFTANKKDLVITDRAGFGPSALSLSKCSILKLLIARPLPKVDGRLCFSQTTINE